MRGNCGLNYSKILSFIIQTLNEIELLDIGKIFYDFNENRKFNLITLNYSRTDE